MRSGEERPVFQSQGALGFYKENRRHQKENRRHRIGGTRARARSIKNVVEFDVGVEEVAQRHGGGAAARRPRVHRDGQLVED